jgi:Spy/CpxP family protein refolding chaperone
VNRKFILVLLIISIAINLTTVATFVYYWSHERPSVRPIGLRPPDRYPEWHGGRLERELKLNEQQLHEIKKVNDDIREGMEPVHDALVQKRHELMLILLDTQPNIEEADRRIREIAALQAEHDTYMFNAMLRIRQILTPEQENKLGMLINRLIAPDRPAPFHKPVPPDPSDQPLPPYQGH